MSELMPAQPTIAVIGLGYVGLPLAVAFAAKYSVLGFDVNQTRIDELGHGLDRTGEVSSEELAQCDSISFSASPAVLIGIDVFIVTVPTPVDRDHRPDLSMLQNASRLVGSTIKPGGIVVFESTVYPGATEEECVPLIEAASGLVFNRDFYVGYSPERINPGDRAHRITDIVKVTSGSTPDAADAIDALYASIIHAGTHRAPSIKVAEAAKVIENTQRDLNIALINELAIIFNRLGIDSADVLAAAGSKWNFLPFKPGLVGGHCIGVDPYYLTHKAERVGYRPEVILAGRRINDGMASYVAGRVIKLMIKKHIAVARSRVLILGVSFKENCPDVRNSKVVDLIKELQDYSVQVDVYDPVADADAALQQHGLELIKVPGRHRYDGVVLAVAHTALADIQRGLSSMLKPAAVVFDIKQVLPREQCDERL